MRWFWTAVIVVLGAVGAYYGYKQHRVIEAGLADRAQDLLAANPEYSRVSLIESRGRIIYLTGRLTDQAQVDALEANLEGEWGVRDVDLSAIELVPLIDDPADYVFSAVVSSGGDVQVTGLAGSRAQVEVLTDAAVQALGAGPDQISITLADPEPEGWGQSVSAGLASLGGLQRGGSLNLSGTDAVLSGTATSAEAYRAALTFPQIMATEANLPGRLDDLRLALDPFTFSAILEEDVLSLSGGQPDAAASVAVEAYGAERFPQRSLQSDLLASQGAPSTTWVADSKVALDTLGSFESGRATLDADSLVLSGILRDGAAQGQTLEDIQARLSANIFLESSGVGGVFYTDRDRARDELFSTIGASTLKTDDGFVLPVPGFAISTQECVVRQERIAEDYPLFFAENADQPLPNSTATIDALAGIQLACAEVLEGWEVQITGHSVIAEEEAEALALTRAKNIKAALVARGVDPALLITDSAGASQADSTIASSPRVDVTLINRAELDRLTVQNLLATNPEYGRVSLIESRGRIIYLTGRLTDQAQVDALEANLEGEWGVRDVDLSAIELVPLIDDPADYVFSAVVSSGGDVQVTGLAGSRAQVEVLTDAAVQALGAGPDQISITLADPEPEGWGQSVSAGLASLGGLQRGGSLNLSGTDAVLSGTATSAEAYRAALTFPQIMATEANLPGRLDDLRLALDPFTFSAILEEDVLSLSGGQPDAAASVAVEAYGAERFPQRSLQSDLLASQGAPSTTWVADSKVALDTLGSFESGRATLDADSLVLSGILRDGAAQGQTLEDIQARLSANIFLESSGVGGVFYTDRDREQDELFSTIGASTLKTDDGFVLPVPGFVISTQECVVRQERIAEDYPLFFAENADQPLPNSTATIDALAGIQLACAEVLEGWEVQITGHSVIAEEEAEALALTRAKNIKAALVARGVDPALLITDSAGASQADSTIASSPRVDVTLINRAELDRRAAEDPRTLEDADEESPADLPTQGN